MSNKFWFRTKKYGWGWVPATWQGWVVMGIYLGVVTGTIAVIGDGFESRAGVTTFIFLTILTTLPLLLVCYWKGEKPRWRWGK